MFRKLEIRMTAIWILLSVVGAGAENKPNIVLIITDDQGFGDLGCHGNPRLKTPAIDKLAAQSVELTRFHVCPVCSPTRSSLLTGRYNYRTGIVDTFWGRSMMYPDETTLAEYLIAAGYSTGIFGKWHLGDCAPMRPVDQGFADSLVIRGGGLRQPSDPPGSTGYFDPTLYRSGLATKTKGFCSDIFTDEAIAFIDRNRREGKPFFLYLPFNCPHTPLEIDAASVKPYRSPPMQIDDFPVDGQPIDKDFDPELTAKLYATVTDIDGNVGRLLTALDQWKLAENTIVIFMTDNGPQQSRFNCGMRGKKGSVYDGGIRVPFFVRWPGRLEAGRKADVVAAHIDVTPTLLEACGVREALPGAKPMDGISLLPILEGRAKHVPERTLFFQWHRGNIPELGRAFAARTSRWKLVQSQGVNGTQLPKPLPFELFDMQADPFEMHNQADAHPEIVRQLYSQYSDWYSSVRAEHQFQPPLIKLGRTYEAPANGVTLTQQDWRGPDDKIAGNKYGRWLVDADRGKYQITLQFLAKRKLPKDVPVECRIGSFELKNPKAVKHSTSGLSKEIVFDAIDLPQGPADIEALAVNGTDRTGADFVIVHQLDEPKPK